MTIHLANEKENGENPKPGDDTFSSLCHVHLQLVRAHLVPPECVELACTALDGTAVSQQSVTGWGA